ncbi:hypothetical protein EWM64_g2239 [Hericium alpestre]|uniref:F-box domain-containing protein n=1 Tax=Hericium alpestre TaxID=135208 RepID=A0A4Z0A777_9AGAM|nr:hypothetical protein EWM64_g2239 [Hericium alpestre]
MSLACLALVNKQWLQAARDVLYSHVHLGSSERSVRKTIESLLRTLSGSPALAKIVRAIDFGSFYMEEGETKGLAKVIKLCDNLCEVRLNGWNSYELKDLVDALKSKKRLQVLDISHSSLSDRDCGCFCYLPEFLEMLQGWPELRSATVWMDTVDYDYSGFSSDAGEEAPTAVKVIPGACPELRRFNWLSGCLEQRHLAAISQIAPSLSEFQLKEGSTMTRQDLLVPLQLWAPRLTHFGLNFYEQVATRYVPDDDMEPIDRHLDDIISDMPLLRILDISSMFLKPATLSHGFPALTILDYRISAEELDEFISILSDPNAMPSLFELSLGPRVSRDRLDSDLLDKMHTLCRSRGITLRGQFYREMLDWGISI